MEYSKLETHRIISPTPGPAQGTPTIPLCPTAVSKHSWDQSHPSPSTNTFLELLFTRGTTEILQNPHARTRNVGKQIPGRAGRVLKIPIPVAQSQPLPPALPRPGKEHWSPSFTAPWLLGALMWHRQQHWSHWESPGRWEEVAASARVTAQPPGTLLLPSAHKCQYLLVTSRSSAKLPWAAESLHLHS